MEILHWGKVNEDGKLHINRHQDFDMALLQFKNCDIEILVRKKKKVRSSNQNRLWWSYMNILSAELGYSKDEIHDICKFKFLKREKVIERTGEVIEYLESTSKLTTTEFMTLIDSLISWAAELKIELPAPNQQTEFNYGE